MNKTLYYGKDISLTFDVGNDSVVAVNRCRFEIPEGLITIIYGPSGSGKSSLLNILSGLQSPSTGKLFYGKDDVYSQSKNELAYFRAHELGIVYQTNYWVKSLNVLDNVSMPLFFLGMSRKQAHELARDALHKVHMGNYANKFPITLSGGEQQRIAMARAIVDDPPVIIADEPTGNLDSANGDKIIELLVDLNSRLKKTVVLVTHNLEYLPIAQHLLEIQDGNVKEIERNEIPVTVKLLLKDVESRIGRLAKKGATL